MLSPFVKNDTDLKTARVYMDAGDLHSSYGDLPNVS
jgi:hypothetical protein